MIIDILGALARGGICVRDYQYTGMGSFYFVDFILMHRYLGIQKLLSAEKNEDLATRVRFNKPFRLIKTFRGAIGESLPGLSKRLRHIVWLDYDFHFNTDIVSDVLVAGYELTSGSIIMVTVDATPPGRDDSPRASRQYFERHGRRYLPVDAKIADFSQSNLAVMNSRVLFRLMAAAAAQRDGVEFLPLFSFSYADGHQMYTIGGMIGGAGEREQIRRAKLTELSYARTEHAKPPFTIRVPKVTRKERLYLDAAMPCGPKWRPKAFPLAPEDIEAYSHVYRHLPNFAELLL